MANQSPASGVMLRIGCKVRKNGRQQRLLSLLPVNTRCSIWSDKNRDRRRLSLPNDVRVDAQHQALVTTRHQQTGSPFVQCGHWGLYCRGGLPYAGRGIDINS